MMIPHHQTCSKIAAPTDGAAEVVSKSRSPGRSNSGRCKRNSASEPTATATNTRFRSEACGS